MAALHITVILSALALLPNGAVAEEAHKPLMRKATATVSIPESLSQRSLPKEAPKPLIRSAKAKSQPTGIESASDTMHTQWHLMTIRSKAEFEEEEEDTDVADDVGAKDSPQDTAAAAQDDLLNRRTLLNLTAAQDDLLNRRTLLNLRNAIEDDTDDSTKADTLLQALVEEDTAEDAEEYINLQGGCRRRGRRRRGCSDSTGRRRRGKSSS
jgi:hypothetical protein